MKLVDMTVTSKDLFDIFDRTLFRPEFSIYRPAVLGAFDMMVSVFGFEKNYHLIMDEKFGRIRISFTVSENDKTRYNITKLKNFVWAIRRMYSSNHGYSVKVEETFVLGNISLTMYLPEKSFIVLN